MTKKFYVQSLWIDPVIGDLQLLCLNSFIKNNIEFHLYTYKEISNVPDGVVVKDANEIIDQKLIFKDNKKSYATFSDWFRIKLLYNVGGWWVDCDVLFIKRFNFNAKYVFATESFFNKEKLEIRICNAVLKMPKKSVVGKKVLDRIQTRLEETNVEEIAWTEIGAGFLRDELIDEGLEKYILIPQVFCPNAWNTFSNVTADAGLEIDDDTYAIHLWNKMWEWNNIMPLESLQHGSVLASAKSKFLS